MAEIAFDATTVPPQQEFDLLPAGKYLAQIIDSDVSMNSKGTGQVLKLTFEVLEGEYANRRLWARLNITHENADAERIGRAQLSALCHAIGVTQLKDTVDLHDKPVVVTVKIRKDKTGQYPDSNDVAGFSSVSAASAATFAKPATPAKPASSTPPWAAKKVA